VGGRRAYAAARRGQPLALADTRVVVHHWVVRARRDADLDVRIACGAGTYVRALARDLGRASESAAHLSALRRVRSGPFDVAAAADLDALRAGRATVHAPRAAVPSLPVVQLDANAAQRIRRGQDIPRSTAEPRAALVNEQGELVAIAEPRDGRWHPCVVLAE
jgi:tRNA pseudouridine55 synthase